MNKLILIDAYALIFRSYYGLIRSPRINSKGMNTGAIMGFCNTLHEVINKENPTHIGVAFDHGLTFRHEAYPPYKAQREATPEDIKKSVPYIKRILQAMHIPIYQADGFEADDVIGTLATQAGQQGVLTYMLTPDKDYGQLITDNVYMYRPRHKGGYDIMGKDSIMEKYGVPTAAQVIDYLALMGDSADNYPGCPGVGEKTAAKLINEYETVEQLIENSNQLKGKLKERVQAAVEDIKMSKYLATIRTDVPVTLDMDELAIKAYDEKQLAEIFQELEFKTMAAKWLKTASSGEKTSPVQLNLFEEMPTDDKDDDKNVGLKCKNDLNKNYKLIDNKEEAIKLFDFLMTKEIVASDTETTSIDPMSARLVGFSFSVEPHHAYYVAVPEDRRDAQEMVDIFKPLWQDTHITKVGQNIKYDYVVLRRYGVKMAGPLFDTMLAHYVIQPELRHNMDFMAETLLNYRTIHIEEIIGPAGKNQKNMGDVPPEQICDYAAEDADVTLQLYQVLKEQLKESGAEQVFYEIEMPLMPVLAEMEMTGVCLDTETLSEVKTIFMQRMETYEHNAYQHAGEQFNLSSPKQVGEILFDKLHIVDKPKKTRTGQYVTSEEVLSQYRDKSPIVDDILNYRGMKKLLSTYIEALPKLINSETGRIHTSFNQAVTATGRLSSSDPNLQNIPVRDDDGKEIRRCFVPEPGCLFFSADYSQMELRLMAHLSGDCHLIDAFCSGQDIHRATAAKIWKIPLEAVTDSQRKKAKQANFGIIYGISAFGLAQRMGIENGEARNLIADYFNTFPQVKEYMESAKQTARDKGYAETMFGRRRYLPDITSANATVRSFAERNAINAPIQGTEADIIKKAMIAIHRRFEAEGLRSKMILQVHDELNFSVYPEEKQQVEDIVINEMQNAAKLNVPLTAEPGWGKNWLEAH